MTRPPGADNFTPRVPHGDNRVRRVCDACGWVDYTNPVVVVGVVSTWEDRILLCRRAIDPRDGFWTIPAGYMEQGETAEDGALREADEEANARLTIDALLGVYSIPRISQIQIIFRARLTSPDVSPGDESRDVRLFAWEEIPWDELAFPSVRWALEHHRSVEGRVGFAPFSNPTLR